MSNYSTSKVIVVTFATEDFEAYRGDLLQSANKYRLTRHLSYGVPDLKKSVFYEKNKHIFAFKRGFGFWLWKPYFILQALNQVKDGEIVFYVDSGAMFINDPAPLLTLAETNESGFVAFNHQPVTIKEFTKRDTFINMGCDSSEYHDAHIIMAGIMLIRKSANMVSFIEEWLASCENFDSLSDVPNKHQVDNLPGFISHREDQSIFSILIKKYQFETYRDPSKWGNFRKLPEFREIGELVCYPWLLNDSITDYSSEPDTSSPYKTIFELNRKTVTAHQKPREKVYEKLIKKIFRR